MAQDDSFSDWILELRRRLTAELPGRRAHRAMIPRPRSTVSLPHRPEDARAAAVLALLTPRAGTGHDFRGLADVEVLLTLRAEGVGRHQGQVCLPGGVGHEGESLRDTAWRETREEVGVPEKEVELLGRLSPVFIPVSGFLVHPFVGVADPCPRFEPFAPEVERLLQVPLSALEDEARRSHRWGRRDGVDVFVPFFELEGEQVWGATAMILSELRELCR